MFFENTYFFKIGERKIGENTGGEKTSGERKIGEIIFWGNNSLGKHLMWKQFGGEKSQWGKIPEGKM